MRNAPHKAVGIGIVWVLAMMVMGGCKKDIRDFCEKEINCIGGNSNDEGACVDHLWAQRKAAKEYDCRKPWDNMMECQVENSRCESGYLDDNGDCVEKSEKLSSCIAKSSALLSEGDFEEPTFYDDYYDYYSNGGDNYWENYYYNN